MGEGEAAGGISPDTVIVRAAMAEGSRHLQGEILHVETGKTARRINESSNTAHKNLS